MDVGEGREQERKLCRAVSEGVEALFATDMTQTLIRIATRFGREQARSYRVQCRHGGKGAE